jgi:Pyruvate/2-oxoacid:ferredoxin oxidoreductase delta subunit
VLIVAIFAEYRTGFGFNDFDAHGIITRGYLAGRGGDIAIERIGGVDLDWAQVIPVYHLCTGLQCKRCGLSIDHQNLLIRFDSRSVEVNYERCFRGICEIHPPKIRDM